MAVASLHSIQVGRTAPLGPERVPSAFRKRTAGCRIAVERLGLDGDEQADLTVHGGPEKAVYAYPLAHYAAWAGEYPEHRAKFVPGGFGENLTIDSLVESDLCVGDVHRIGSATLQVCQPRQPCFKLVLFFAEKRLPKAMVRNGRAGWYYRVLETGLVEAGDPILLHDRPNASFGFDRLVEIANFGRASSSELEALAEMDGLASNWRARARDMLSVR